jgi:hypothetical protein
MERDRVLHAWALLLVRHPLLMSKISEQSYDDIYFSYDPPPDIHTVLTVAKESLRYRKSTDNLVEEYMNGPRILGPHRASILQIGLPESNFGSSGDLDGEYEVMIMAAHTICDGMAHNSIMNELYMLLGSDNFTASLADMIVRELDKAHRIPRSVEERLPPLGGGSKLARKIGEAEYQKWNRRYIGNQTFPRSPSRRKPRYKRLVLNYSAEETSRILEKCTARRISITHAVFALCNLAWARQTGDTAAPTSDWIDPH